MVICIVYWHCPTVCLRAQATLKLRELKDFDSMGCIMLAEEVGAGVSSLAYFTITVKGTITFPVCFLHVLSEALSVKKSSEIATAFREDGLVGDAINNFGRPAQERDFFRWALV